MLYVRVTGVPTEMLLEQRFTAVNMQQHHYSQRNTVLYVMTHVVTRGNIIVIETYWSIYVTSADLDLTRETTACHETTQTTAEDTINKIYIYICWTDVCIYIYSLVQLAK